MAQKELGPGSEGDAYRYTKKVLMSLPNAARVESIYREIAMNKGISSWTRACYEELRTQFFRDGQCKIKFAPGVARIAYGELEFGTGDEDFRQLADLRDFIRIISIAHFESFTRHLAIDGKELSFKDMVERFGNTVSSNWKELKEELRRIKYGPRRYKVIWLDSFATARPYYEYTKPHNWCHLGNLSMFRSYSFNRKTDSSGISRVSIVKLYLAVLPGFETMTEDDPLYGESMLGIDIGPDGRLIHVNNRWNHSHDKIDDRKGDNKYSEKELSELLGGPFYKICPPMTKREVRHISGELKRRRDDENRAAARWVRGFADRVADRVRKGKPGKEIGKFVDSRDNMEYRTRRIGGVEWMLDPMSHLIVQPLNCAESMAKHVESVRQSWNDLDNVAKKTMLKTAVAKSYAGVEDSSEEVYDSDSRDSWVLNTVYKEDNDIPVDISTLAYCPMVSVMSSGRINLFLETDVGKISRSGATDEIEQQYVNQCMAYREKRMDIIERRMKDAGKTNEMVSRDRAKIPGSAPDGYDISGMEAEPWNSVEVVSPLGFGRAAPTHGLRPSDNGLKKMLVNDTVPGKQFVYYRMDELSKVMPEGWRLPTVDEFVAMAMSAGAKAVFRSSYEYNSDNHFTLTEAKKDILAKARRAPHLEFSTADGKFRRRLYEGVIISEIERIGCNLDEINAADIIPPSCVTDGTITVRDPVPGAGDADVDEDMDINNTVDSAEESADDLASVPPAVGARLPDLGFDMGDAGFAIPNSSTVRKEFMSSDEEEQVKRGGLSFTRYPILLSLAEDTEFADKKAVKWFDRMFNRFSPSTDSTREMYDEDEENENTYFIQMQNALRTDVAPTSRRRYALAEWDSNHRVFRIRPCGSSQPSNKFCLMYAVR